ncbi:MAG: XylR family transcriptional regulator [Planctomycetaceae bacterium]|nr:XylR family transcriptional regulator [Planctomycetaceae bacterium]
MPQERPHVAILIETSKAYGRGLLRGVADYLKLHGPWSVYIDERALGDPPPPWLQSWNGDGILIRETNKEALSTALKTGAAVVNLGEQEHADVPHIRSDEQAISELAADHLQLRGFRNFGYVGLPESSFSDSRHRFFVETLSDNSCAFFSFPSTSINHASWESGQDQLAEWLVQLPKPIGLMACYDVVGFRVLEACRRAGLSVPDEVAVVGVDNDAELCALSNPPLSSIEHCLEKIGFQAAELLNNLMTTNIVAPSLTLVRPTGVVTRQSTDIIAIDDTKVAAACRFIRENACKGMTVPKVAEHVALSRRALERRFHNALKRSPQSELRRVQIERVRQLLEDTDYKLSVIAQMSGFRYHEYMSKVFKEKVGISPGTYRKTKRRDSSGTAQVRANITTEINTSSPTA